MSKVTWDGKEYTPQPYAGFLYDGKHSFEDFKIYRVSDGSRFNENLLPTLQDKTVQVPGNDGTYYFGSFYTQRQFSVQIAFDSLTEAKLKEMKSWLSGKKIAKLRFDEEPKKFYMAKVTGNSTIKHIPFDSEGSTSGTIYKGEGTIQFTCYFPFGKISQAVRKGQGSSGDFYNIGYNNQGDFPTAFKCAITFSASTTAERWFALSLKEPASGTQTTIDILCFKVPKGAKNISIDTRTKILKIENEINNFKITSGDFFDLPRGQGGLYFYELTAQGVQYIPQKDLKSFEIDFDEIYI